MGVIDTGFSDFQDLQKVGELPSSTKLSARCYASDTTTTVTTDIANCKGKTGDINRNHGTLVSQTVMDTAPDVHLYVSNAIRGSDHFYVRARLKSDIQWMIQQGVDVINMSVGFGLTLGLGDGVPQYASSYARTVKSSILDFIKTATDAGVVWVNSAGNRHKQRWHGSFQDYGTSPNYVHNYSLTDERNYVSHPLRIRSWQRTIYTEMRWDDSWEASDCDIDLILYRHRLPVGNQKAHDMQGYRTASARASQAGALTDRPFETLSYTIPFRDLTTVRQQDGTLAFAPKYQYYLEIKKAIRPASPSVDRCTDMDLVELFINEPYTLEHIGTGYSISHPADSNSPGLLATGATQHNVLTRVTRYSGRGPTTDGRVKPDVGGTTCGQAIPIVEKDSVKTLLVIPFCGTSQAAPHVAGLAALVIDRYDKPNTRQ